MENLFDTISQTEFEQYDAEHPEIWELFKKFTFELIQRGRRHGGAKAVWERLRWDAPVDRNGDEYKCNNNFTAAYARKFMRTFPGRRGFFKLRKAKGE